MFERVKSSILACVLFILGSCTLTAQTAPDFSITDSDGQMHELFSDYLDQGKTVVVKIFFVNCPPCAAIAPEFQALYEEWGEGQGDVEFFELSNKSWDSNADVAGWKNMFGLSFPSAGEDGGALAALQPYLSGQFGPFFGTPTFFVIAPDRTVDWDISAPGEAATILAIDQAISATGAEKPGGGTMSLPSSFSVIARDAFGQEISNVEYFLASASSSQEYPVSLDNGSFQITDLEEEYPGLTDPVIRARKSDDLKAKLSAIDIIIIVRHILNLVSIEDPRLLTAADTNSDGNISAVDLITLQRVILGLINNFPGTAPYVFQPSEFPISLQPGETQVIGFEGIKIGDLNGF